MLYFQDIDSFSDMNLDVEAQLDQKVMTLRELLAFSTDSIIRFSRLAGDNIDLLIGGHRICSGEIVINGDTVGVRITDFREEA